MNTATVHHAATCNAKDDLATLEDRIRAALAVSKINIATALLCAQLHSEGCAIKQSFFSNRVKITLPDGEVISPKTAWRRLRVNRLVEARCKGCTDPIPTAAYARVYRGGRIDRDYCSNACRQKAYRSRKDEGAT